MKSEKQKLHLEKLIKLKLYRRIIKKCNFCFKTFDVPPYKKDRFLCSLKCVQKNNIGIKRSKEHKNSIRESKLAENNPMWKGDKVGYAALHKWIKSRLPKPKFCQNCKKISPYDLANISQDYVRDLLDWEWLCRKCHMMGDGRIKNLKQYQNA